MEKRLINMLPKTMQQKGRALLDHLKEATDLKWNERGELVHQGEIIRDSNISDLMNETVRARKDSIKPKGWDLFAQVLRKVMSLWSLLEIKISGIQSNSHHLPCSAETR